MMERVSFYKYTCKTHYRRACSECSRSCFFVDKCECRYRSGRGLWKDCSCIYTARIGKHDCECRYNEGTKAFPCICCGKIIYNICRSCVKHQPACVICGRRFVRHWSSDDCSSKFWSDCKYRDALGFLCCPDHSEARRCEYIKAQLEIRLSKLTSADTL